MVGRRMIELSGGEWQKLFSQSIYERCASFNFDEPTQMQQNMNFQRFAELTKGKSAV
jgi:ABC-type Mn2+/Zn2+ transport system ATPase subunit